MRTITEKEEKKKAWPKIREVRHKNGAKAWLVDGRVMQDGKATGERFFFKTKTEADTKASQLRTTRKNDGASSVGMSSAMRGDAEAAIMILAPHGKSLKEAAEFYDRHHPAVDQKITVTVLLNELEKSKKKDGASSRYLKDIRSKLQIFAASFPEQVIAEFSTPIIDDWLRGLPHSSITRNNYRRILGVLFNYAIQRNYCLINPVKRTSRAKVVDKPPGVLMPEQCANLLVKAEEEIRPAIALGLFAGLRPEAEVWRLDWSDIDFEAGLICIEAAKTKSAQHRLVEMMDNLKLWLTPHRKRSGAVSPTGDKYNYLLQRARDAAKITGWPQDCLRHCYGSYHYAQFQDPGKTMVQMGHTNIRTFHAHYRARVIPSNAAQYWEIKPTNKSENIIA